MYSREWARLCIVYRVVIIVGCLVYNGKAFLWISFGSPEERNARRSVHADHHSLSFYFPIKIVIAVRLNTPFVPLLVFERDQRTNQNKESKGTWPVASIQMIIIIRHHCQLGGHWTLSSVTVVGSFGLPNDNHKYIFICPRKWLRSCLTNRPSHSRLECEFILLLVLLLRMAVGSTFSINLEYWFFYKCAMARVCFWCPPFDCLSERRRKR